MIALAPINWAFFDHAVDGKAAAVLEQLGVCRTSLPASALHEAPIPRAKPMLRTSRPKHAPSARSSSHPGNPQPVVTGRAWGKGADAPP